MMEIDFVLDAGLKGRVMAQYENGSNCKKGVYHCRILNSHCISHVCTNRF